MTGPFISASALALLALLAGAPGAAPASTEPGLHRPFDELLRAHVDDGRVDYPAFAASPLLGRYLAAVRDVDPAAIERREARLAFWINAYNALAIRGILDGGSPRGLLGRIGYFKLTTYDVGRRSINLYDLEREVLIPMGEPRVHFAIVCASMSCPPLRAEAYRAERLERQLEEAARRFINDESKNRFDPERKVARLSKIFDWYASEFEIDGGGVLDYVARYVDDPALAGALRAGGWRIEHLRYDWDLNGIPPAS